MTQIKIDLRDLTPEKLEQAKPNMRLCDYTSPCIIGTLIPEEHRRPIERGEYGNEYGNAVDDLIEAGVLAIPEEQERDAILLQSFFDSGDWDDVVRIANRYMTEKVEA